MKKFNQFFFIDYPRYLIEIFRIIFFGYLFISELGSTELSGYLQLSENYWTPTGLFIILDFLKPPIEIPILFYYLWITSLLFCSLGIFAYFFKWIVLFLSLIFLGYFSNFFLYTADKIILTYILIVFTFCKFGRSFTLENIIFKKIQNISEVIPGWTIRFIQVIYVITWFGSGIQKIRISGLDWVFTNHIQFHVNKNPNGFHVIETLSHLGLALSLLLELISPLIFIKNLKYYILPMMFCFHLFSMITLQLPLAVWLIGFIFWIDQEAVERIKRIFGLKKL